MSDELYLSLARDILCARIKVKHPIYSVREDKDYGKVLVELAMAIKKAHEASATES